MYAVTSTLLEVEIDLDVVCSACRNVKPAGSSKQTSVFLCAISATATAVCIDIMRLNYR